MTCMRMLTIGALLAAPSLTAAQPLGTFRWQLQPFCNVVTLAVTQNGGVYRLEGTDDQCGNGADQTSAIGMAFLNPDGTIGFGFHVVTPGGQPVHVESRLTLPSLNGTWRDSAGNAGTFAFTAGSGSGGGARPQPPPPSGGDVTGVIAGAGLSGGGSGGDVPIAVDTAVIQNRVGGSCAAGQAVRTINENGTVACEPIPPAAVPPQIQLRPDGGLVAGGAVSVGAIPASGPGTRMMWFPGKAAFRAGVALGSEWDEVNVGLESVALGQSVSANGRGSIALGTSTVASGGASVALGISTTASGARSTAMGFGTLASGTESTAIGEFTTASGRSSTAMGGFTVSSAESSTAMGQETTASGFASTAMGRESIATGVASLAAGHVAFAGGTASIALGSQVSASTNGTFMFGDASAITPMLTFVPNQFLVRAAGGVGFYSKADLSTGVELLPDANAWSSASDVRKKTAFRDLAHEEVLDRIAAMPVSEWSYIAQGESIRHIGPMAQDFHAAFGLGEDPLRISTQDAEGVALAAVRALEARTREILAALRQRDDEVREQAGQIAALEADVAALRALVATGSRRPQ